MPAELAAQIVAEVSESRHILRKCERHGRTAYLGLEPLLEALLPEVAEIRRGEFAEEDFGAKFLEVLDIGGEVLEAGLVELGEIRVTTGRGQSRLERCEPRDHEGVVG